MTADRIDLKRRDFTADALPERGRLPHWREEFGKIIVDVDWSQAAASDGSSDPQKPRT